MSDAWMTHPTPQDLADYGQGKLSVEQQSRITDHLAGCPACQERIAAEPTGSFAGRHSPSPSAISTASWPGLPSGGRPGEGPGEGLADYELLHEIARGGMGVVYKARQRKLNRLVALKMILSGEFAGPEQIRRFYTEAEAAARLDHPAIVPVHEVGEHNGRHFLSMAFVEGRSLHARVKDEGPLAPGEAAALMKTVSEAVHYAHERGIVHRDLKPGNILLDLQGQPRVTDFGLAKNVAGDSGMTATGQILGTPSYMPPEQASGKMAEVGPRSDVYSLGATLYCLLTGRPPFQTPSPMETLRQVLHQEPVAPRLLNASVPRDLETICLKCLRKDPLKRYPSARELAEDLDRYLNDHPIRARRVSSTERFLAACRRHPGTTLFVLLFISALIAGTAVSVYFAIEANFSADEAREATQLANENADNFKAAAERAEREGQKARTAEALANEAKQDARWDAYVLAINSIPETLATGNVTKARAILEKQVPSDDEEDFRNFEWFYYWRLCHAEQASLPGLERRVYTVALAPDDRTLVLAGDLANQRVQFWGLDGEQHTDAKGTRPLFSGKGLAGGHVTQAVFSPDGKQLITAIGSPGHAGKVQVWEWPSTRAVRTIGEDLLPVLGLAVSPDQKHLIVATANLAKGRGTPSDRYLPTDPAKKGRVRVFDALTGKEQPALPDSEGQQFFAVDISPDGRLLAAGTEGGAIHLWDMTQRTLLNKLDHHSGRIWAVRFSPDSRNLAAASGNWDEPGEVYLYRLPTTQDRPVALRGHRAGVTSVAFSPDGKTLASGSFDHNVKLWDVEKVMPLTTLYGHRSYVWSMQFTRSGEKLITGGWGFRTESEVKVWDLSRHRARFSQHLISRTRSNYSIQAADEETRVEHIWSTQRNTAHGIRINDQQTGKVRGEHVFSDPNPGVLFVRLSPDGKLVAAGGWPSKIYLFDAQSGQLRTTLEHGAGIPNGVFSPDSSLLVGGGNDSIIRIWDVSSGQLMRALTGHNDVVWYVTFSPDGKRLASASWDETVKIWDVRTGALLTTLTGHTGPVWGVEFLLDGKALLSESADETLRVWDARPAEGSAYPGDVILAQEPYRKLFPEPAGERFVAVDWPRVASVPRTQIDLNSIAALSPDGKSLAVCEVEHGKEQRYFVKLFAVEEQQPQHRFQVKGSTREMCFSPDGTGLLTATQGGFEEVKAGSQVGYLPRPGKARVWDVSSGEVLFDLDEHRLTLQQQNAVFSPDGQWIAAANGDRTVLVWNARNGTLHRKLTADSQMLTVAFSPEGDLLMAGGSGRLVVWETEGWKLHRTLTLEKAFVRRILVHPDGKHLTLLVDPVGKQVDEVQTLELGTGKVLSRFSADLASAVMADGGSKLVHLHPDRKLVVVRELLTGRVHRILLSPSGYAVDLLPQGDDVLLTGPTPADRNVTGVWRMPR